MTDDAVEQVNHPVGHLRNLVFVGDHDHRGPLRVDRAQDFEDLARGLTRTVDAYNSSVGTLESRVLVTARKFKELGISANEPIPELSPVDQTPRALQAPEHADLLGDLVDREPVEEEG